MPKEAEKGEALWAQGRKRARIDGKGPNSVETFLDPLSDDFFSFSMEDLSPFPLPTGGINEEGEISEPLPLILGAQAAIAAGQAQWEARKDVEAQTELE